MPHSRTFSRIAVSLIWFAMPALAQYVQLGSKLIGSGSIGTPAQGTSVAVSADGSTAIIGGALDNEGAGAAWVFTRVNGAWVQQGAKLVGSGATVVSGGAPGVAAQGSAVALSADGNTAIVGGMNDSGSLGAIWAFTRNNGVWTQQGTKLWGTVLLGISHQGISVAVSADGNTALVGGDLDNNYGGAAWVFKRTNGVWSIIPDKLVGNLAVGMAHQGVSVALSADGATAILGGPGDNSGSGATWVFTNTNGVWTQQGNKLLGIGASVNATQGTSVALSTDGNTAVVGGSGDNNNAGALWVYTRANGQWTQQGGKLTGTNAVPSRYLGESAALSGDGNTAIVGGPGGLTTTLGRPAAIGATWIFTRSNGAWNQQGTEIVGTGTVGSDALQGSAVAVTADGTTALVGGPADNGIGSVWVFTRPPTPVPPVITTHPLSQTLSNGQTATLSVVASGAAPLNYQWFQGASGNTSAPVGTNSSSYSTPPLTVTTSYWVRVSNQFGSVNSNTATVTIPVSSTVITRVTNAASHSATIAPNTWVEIDGANLAPAGVSRIWKDSDFVNNQLPLVMDGVSVTVNGKRAFVYYISPTQVNILTPPDAMQGPVLVQVFNGGNGGTLFTVQAQPTSPAFFVFGSGPYVAAEHANGSYLGPTTLIPAATTPAKPGETIVLFATGFGPTTPPVVSGSLVQSGLLPVSPVIIIGGVTATVRFAGLISPGEFQFNVDVPSTAGDGDNTITAVYNGIVTQTGVLVTVQR